MLRAILFDLDDTLVDQASAAATAVTAWAAEHDVTGENLVLEWVRISDLHYASYQRRELTFAEQRRERVREFLKAKVGDDEADAMFAKYLARYEAAWAPFDDAAPALRRARSAGLTVAVFTNGDEDQQRSKLTRVGLIGEVDRVIASSALSAGKPDVRAFHEALALIRADEGEALMVGDSLEVDVRGALDAGLSAVLLDRNGAHDDVDVQRVRSLAELCF